MSSFVNAALNMPFSNWFADQWLWSLHRHAHQGIEGRRRERTPAAYLLSVWRKSPFYSDRERAALTSTEAVTLITNGDVPDEIYETARAQFSEEELANLTVAIAAINGANRLNIAFRTVPPGPAVIEQRQGRLPSKTREYGPSSSASMNVPCAAAHYAPRTRSIMARASDGASSPRQATWPSGRTSTSLRS